MAVTHRFKQFNDNGQAVALCGYYSRSQGLGCTVRKNSLTTCPRCRAAIRKQEATSETGKS